MKKVFALALAAAVCLSISACGRQNQPGTSGNQSGQSSQSGTPSNPSTEAVEFQLGVAQEDTNPYSQGAYYLADLVAEKSEGRMKITVYTGGQLGGEADMTESVGLGTIDMCLTSNAPLTNFSERFNLFELPYMFTSYEQIDAVLDGDIGAELLADLESLNIKGLAYFENGFRNITNSVREINEPADLKGIKLRTMESAAHIDVFTALGANPTPMAWGEVYTALQQKTIDGQENPLLAIKGNKIYEVNKYLSLTEHVYTPVELIMNLDKFNALSSEDQQLLLECAQEAAVYERGIAREVNSDVQFFIDQGIIVSQPDKEPFQEIAKTVWGKYTAPLGDLVDRVQALG